eukprot:1486816-Rhodomonas_salina.2
MRPPGHEGHRGIRARRLPVGSQAMSVPDILQERVHSNKTEIKCAGIVVSRLQAGLVPRQGRVEELSLDDVGEAERDEAVHGSKQQQRAVAKYQQSAQAVVVFSTSSKQQAVAA